MPMKELDAFNIPAITEAVAIIEHLESQGKTVDDLRRYALKLRENQQKEFTIKQQIPEDKRRKKSTTVKPHKKTKGRTRVIPLIGAGDIEQMTGVICEKCHEMVYIEGVCGRNKIVGKGFTRRGLCGSCGNEFLIR